MRVFCVEKGDMKYLTLGKWYKTDDLYYSKLYNIICDNGKEGLYSKTFFITEKEFYNKQFNKKLNKIISNN